MLQRSLKDCSRALSERDLPGSSATIRSARRWCAGRCTARMLRNDIFDFSRRSAPSSNAPTTPRASST
jgi:hypothetical protein